MRVAEHPRVVAIIQARMGSTRFPGKVLHDIAGKPLLWHVIHRLQGAKRIDRIVIATTTAASDDALLDFGRRNDIPVVRGSEYNVLARFDAAAMAHKADIIVRVCSDSPFIDGAYIDSFIEGLIAQKCDYVLPEEGKPNAHQGIDVFTRRALDKLVAEAGEDHVAREHVSGYLKLHPDFVPIATVPPYPGSYDVPSHLSVDTPDDLAFVSAVYDRLKAAPGEVSLADLLRLLKQNPDIARINSHVRQKTLKQREARALIRVCGGRACGYGHVKRMVMLARFLRDQEGIGVSFVLSGDMAALKPIRHAGFEAAMMSSPDTLMQADLPPFDIYIVDSRDDVPSRADLERFSKHTPLIVVVDDISERRLAADLAYYPPVPQVRTLSWEGSKCRPRVGWQWAILGVPGHVARPYVPGSRLTLLISMGGSDPLRLTLRAAMALQSLPPVFRARFVIGPGISDGPALARDIAAMGDNFETIEGADDLMTEYASADLALAAFGVTAYELASFGVPAIYLGITTDHVLSASAFDAAGMGVSLGLAEDVPDRKLAQTVWSLLTDQIRRNKMHDTCLELMSGDGAARVAADIAEVLAAKRKEAE